MTRYREPKPVPGQAPTLYHGTRAGFKKGGYLFPPRLHHGPLRPGAAEHELDFIYMTTDHGCAVAFARLHRGRGRPKVLTVVPSGEVEPDPLAWEYESEGYRSRGSARVVAVEFVDEEEKP